MPAIGATENGDGRSTDPIFISVRLHVGGVEFNADRLADEIDRHHDHGLWRVLPDEPADEAAQQAGNRRRTTAEKSPRGSIVWMTERLPCSYCASVAWICLSPSSYARCRSGFLQSMIACDRSFCRYFWYSSLRLSVKTRSLICSRA